jgi:RHS repeat-associated protein
LAGKYKISIGTASFITGAAIGPVSLTFMPTATNMTLTIRKVAPIGGAIAQLGIKYISYDSVSVQPYTAVSKICSEDNYHYGFNGKYKDNEWAGVGNSMDYGFRRQDTRTGRFISVDPLTKEYPMLTPYQFASNLPIAAIDWDGLEAKVVTYGQKNKEDDAYIKRVGTTCATELGVRAMGIANGNQALSALQSASSGSHQSISAWVNYGHSWHSGLYLNIGEGFYLPSYTGADGANRADLNGLLRLSSSGNITFSRHALFIFASCGTAGNGAGGHGAGKGTYDPASFAAMIGNYVNKNYFLPNGAYSGTYKITTIGATDLSNLQEDGTVTTDGTFIMTEKVYKIERTVEETGFWFWKKTVFHDKTTVIQTKTTDLGNKIDPASLIKNHNDSDAENH